MSMITEYRDEPFSDEIPESVELNMDEFIGRVTRNAQIRIIAIGEHRFRLVPKISAVGMAGLSRGVNDGNFDAILTAVIKLVYKDDRDKFRKWLEDDEPDMETVMEFMSKAMEIISGKE